MYGYRVQDRGFIHILCMTFCSVWITVSELSGQIVHTDVANRFRPKYRTGYEVMHAKTVLGQLNL